MSEKPTCLPTTTDLLLGAMEQGTSIHRCSSLTPLPQDALQD